MPEHVWMQNRLHSPSVRDLHRMLFSNYREASCVAKMDTLL